ncbi:TetR/AcrR family transcriptional regulator [Methylobacterium sp. J-070]|uniref:TetR/AcrR family transcriptional regulator n=1 Tax=Methylobacterium sp. J-070 TaxID=2836650 RepID=UPI001FB88781|nr:TetR/AcrR family transcriptional regulator [Methylobacterium sp. J-070]MCJ2054855.1 TetR/AcrR family transcriptional regulator [Methylobacterium sp. J-070]
MNAKQGPRPGGRSARVQASVQTAVRELLATMDRSEITVPLIATAAGVTPSTIYRRWGTLGELFADVAVERLRPDSDPIDTGNGWTDLEAWAEQYAEEMSSAPGRELIRDVLAAADTNCSQRCCSYSREQIAIMAERAAERGESFPDPEAVLDGVVSPIVYRILFGDAPTRDRIRDLVGRTMATTGSGSDERH